jgi:probable rRNA maturation factor
MQLTLTIENHSLQTDVPTDAQFETWVKTALHNHKPQAEIGIRLVEKEESAQLNQQYRNKIGATNVLSFASSLPPALAENFLLGDLVICVPLVVEEATAANITTLAHWAHLTVHGCLHLAGYDHEQDDEAEIMENLETQLMQQLGFDDPYQEQH